MIAFVTNGGFLDANTADGLRKTLVEEFTTIHVLNLRGNQRTAGEQSRKEGGKVFGGGSRATVAVTVLVKNPARPGPATVHYTDIGDYLTREEKLARVAEAVGVTGLAPVILTPNEHGDWLGQRRDDFETFMPLGDKRGIAVVHSYSYGLNTARSAWAYASGREALERKMSRLLSTYEHDRRAGAVETLDAAKIKWSRSLEAALAKGRRLSWDPRCVQVGLFRPFQQQWVYFHGDLNDQRYSLTHMFPLSETPNLGFYAVNPGSDKPWSVLMTQDLPDLSVYGSGSGQFFPRWTWEPVQYDGFDFGDSDGEVVAGYRRVDNVTDEALRRWQRAYGEDWTKNDVFFYCYGLLHSPCYRDTYAADLKKMLPRIPLVADAAGARAFADAGRALSDLHVGYESVEPYPLDGLHPADPREVDAAYAFYAVGDKRMRFGKPTAEQKSVGEKVDRSVIHYNDRITVSGIPEEAYRYMLGSRSAVEWIIDRYYIKTDKASGIVNDPNDWSREVGDPRYILDLLARVVTVSVETMRIIDGLPTLKLGALQQ